MSIIIMVFTFIELILGFYFLYRKIKKEPDDFASDGLKILLLIFAIPIILYYIDYFDIGFIFGAQKLISKEAWLGFFGTYFSAVFSAIFSAFIMIHMTSRQIKAQSRENFKPRLMLESAEIIKEETKEFYKYDLTSSHLNGKDIFKTDCNYNILKIRLKNIGVGLAQDIDFYSLVDGEKCVRTQMLETQYNQHTFSTEEIAKSDSYDFYFNLAYKYNEKEEDLIDRIYYALILCKYKDINGNEYEFIFGIRVKSEIVNEDKGEKYAIIDYYYYQPNTDSFNNLVKKYEKSYNKAKKA